MHQDNWLLNNKIIIFILHNGKTLDSWNDAKITLIPEKVHNFFSRNKNVNELHELLLEAQKLKIKGL